MTQPNADQYATAMRELALSGIRGADARTVFTGACRLAGVVGYQYWLKSIRDLTLAECLSQYGSDSARVVWALGHPAPTSP